MMKSSFSPTSIASRNFFHRSASLDSNSNAFTAVDRSPTVASLLEQMISIDETPFLVSQRKVPPSGLIRVDRISVRIGEMLRQGEFTKTFAIRACRPLATLDTLAALDEEDEEAMESSTRRKRLTIGRAGRAIRRSMASFDKETADDLVSPKKYTIKLLVDQSPNDDECETSTEFDGKLRTQQRTQLLREALYLSVLDHPGIIQLKAFPTLNSSNIFVVTDRVAETLEDRITMWRRAKRRAREYERITKERRRHKRSHRRRRSSSGALTPFEEEVMNQETENLVALKTNYALQIATVLEYLHSRGIVVRELRPDTIGFMDYPNHHRVLLCDLSHAKELPLEEPGMLPSTEPLVVMMEEGIEDDDDQTIDNSEISGSSRSIDPSMPNPTIRPLGKAASMNPAAFRHSMDNATLPGFRRVNSDTPTFGRPPSGTLSPARTDSSSHVSSGSCSTSSRWSDASVDKSMALGDESAHTTASMRSQTPSAAVARNCYRAPEMYAVCLSGYNAKVDVFSWAMIYYELMADKRPTRRGDVETVDQLWEQIRTERPSMKQCYFPLSIQQVVQRAWEGDASRRYSSEDLSKALTRVLAVLEGKRLDGTYRNGRMPTKQRTLPQRAARVVRSKAAQGWGDIRKPLGN